MRQARKLFALSLIAAALPALAAEFQMSDTVSATLGTTLSVGTMFRTDAPNPAEYGNLPASVVPGATPGQLVGSTGGSDLNFSKGQAVSTVAQGMVDLSVQGRNFGMFLRGAAWTDLAQGHDAAAYGNYANGYTAGAPLSDRGFAPGARFNGAMVRDAYLSGRFDFGEGYKAEARVGQQVLNWDGDRAIGRENWGDVVVRMIGGGINSAINPNDLVAQLRPGAIPEEAKVAVGMLSLHLASSKEWAADAYVPYETREAVLPGCGTFFDTNSLLAPGCNLGDPFGLPNAALGNVTEPGVMKSGLFVHRSADVLPSAKGQYGLAGHYNFEAIQTVVSAYALNTPSTSPFFQTTVQSFSPLLPNGKPFPVPFLLDPQFMNKFPFLGSATGVEYNITYPSSVKLYGLSFNTAFDQSGHVFGEIAYRPNQPLSQNLSDELSAFLAPTNPTTLIQQQKGAAAFAPGSTYNAYDRFGVATANLGVSKLFANVLGAARAKVGFELGMAHVDDLPNPDVMRYGRSFAYGAAPYMNQTTGQMTACAYPAPFAAKACTTDGFVTTNAWGWRLNASATYSNVLPGLALTPSVLVASDVSGYAYDGSFSAGRYSVRPALRADWNKRYFAQVAYTRMGGGSYNLLADRSNLVLAAGAHF